jgi:hypothetical protein
MKQLWLNVRQYSDIWVTERNHKQFPLTVVCVPVGVGTRHLANTETNTNTICAVENVLQYALQRQTLPINIFLTAEPSSAYWHAV